MKSLKFKIIILSLLILSGCSNQMLGKDKVVILDSLKIKSNLKDNDVSNIVFSKDVGEVKVYDYITDTEIVGKNIRFEENDDYSNLEMAFSTKDKSGGTFHSYDKFYKDSSGKIFFIESGATTTIPVFNELTKVSWIKKLFGKTAHADSDTYYSAGGDAILKGAAQAVWVDALNVNGSAASTDDGSGGYILFGSNKHAGNQNYYIYKFICPMNTAGIDDGATVTLGTFTITGVNVAGYNAGGDDKIVLVEVDSMTNEAVANVDDWDEFSGTTNSDTEITISTWGETNNYTLNAAGKTNINDTGNSLFGFISKATLDETPAPTDWTDWVYAATSNSGVTDPALYLEWTTGGAAAAPAKSPFIMFN